MIFDCGGFLNSKVYQQQLASLAALKDAIRQNVSVIMQEMTFNAVKGVLSRLIAVLLNGRQHIELLLLLTVIQLTCKL